MGKILKSPAVDHLLQSVNRRFNSKAQKSQPLAPETREKWISYYTADQEKLARLLQGLEVVD